MSDKKPISHGRLSISASHKPRELMREQRRAGAWIAKIITLFPDVFPGTLGASLTGKALNNGLWGLETINLRDYGDGKHLNVDDTPAGGGAGMVLRADVVAKALDAAAQGTYGDWPIIYLSPRGKPFQQQDAKRFAACNGVTLLCGRFEGVDQRVLDHYNVEEVSLGDFVLTGGEIAAQALIDSTVRLIPRVLGNKESTEEESFSNGLLEHPQYTRPSVWEDHKIPETLLSGHHGEISKWRRDMAEKLTRQRRPDLWQAYCTKHNKDPGKDSDGKTNIRGDNPE